MTVLQKMLDVVGTAASSFESLLKDPVGCKAFEIFLQQKNCSPALEFLWACQGMKHFASQQTCPTAQIIELINRHYFTSGAILPMLSDKVQRSTDENVKSCTVDIDIFNEAETEVHCFLRDKMYPGFLQEHSTSATMFGLKKQSIPLAQVDRKIVILNGDNLPQCDMFGLRDPDRESRHLQVESPEIFARELIIRLEALQLKCNSKDMDRVNSSDSRTNEMESFHRFSRRLSQAFRKKFPKFHFAEATSAVDILNEPGRKQRSSSNPDVTHRLTTSVKDSDEPVTTAAVARKSDLRSYSDLEDSGICDFSTAMQNAVAGRNSQVARLESRNNKNRRIQEWINGVDLFSP